MRVEHVPSHVQRLAMIDIVGIMMILLFTGI